MHRLVDSCRWGEAGCRGGETPQTGRREKRLTAAAAQPAGTSAEAEPPRSRGNSFSSRPKSGGGPAIASLIRAHRGSSPQCGNQAASFGGFGVTTPGRGILLNPGLSPDRTRMRRNAWARSWLQQGWKEDTATGRLDPLWQGRNTPLRVGCRERRALLGVEAKESGCLSGRTPAAARRLATPAAAAGRALCTRSPPQEGKESESWRGGGAATCFPRRALRAGRSMPPPPPPPPPRPRTQPRGRPARSGRPQQPRRTHGPYSFRPVAPTSDELIPSGRKRLLFLVFLTLQNNESSEPAALPWPLTRWKTAPTGPRYRMVARSSVRPENARARELRHRLEPPVRDPSRPCVPRGLAGPDSHFHTFRSQADFSSIIHTSAMLEACGFYWGPLSVSAAHEKLRGEPVGTFLIRDSRQKNCFFTISVRTASGPTSIRVIFQAGRFSLDGSKEDFGCLFKLLEHYVSSARKVLVAPLRKVRMRSLQDLCRKSIMTALGEENLSCVPLNPVLKDYLASFPFKL
uniref:suppressor of cytokine signaling 1 n=1 Tax=Euleptes europaea TaxID=460621 RepID=UPI002540C4E5|nr:suppressor of cytokine signaling 1 [Euleptes europaea]